MKVTIEDRGMVLTLDEDSIQHDSTADSIVAMFISAMLSHGYDSAVIGTALREAGEEVVR